MEVKEETKVSNNKETSQNTDASDAAASAETNGIDNEDSINLTIGEDEENLLAEEVSIFKFEFFHVFNDSLQFYLQIYNFNLNFIYKFIILIIVF